jgi:hypothetical protein
VSFFPLVTATLLKSYPIRYLVLTAACARRVRRIQAGMVIVRICSRPLHARRMDGHQSKLQSNLFASIQTIEPGLYVPPLPHFPKGFHNQVVRIEDEVLVREDDCVVLSVDAPKEVVDVEARCQGLLDGARDP